MLVCVNVNQGMANLSILHLNGEEAFYQQYSANHSSHTDTQMLMQPKVQESKIHFVLENGDVFEIDYKNSNVNCSVNIRR